MKKFGSILWGVVLITIGAIFGLNALNITDINIFFDGWWTLFIIVPCFIGLFSDREKLGNVIGLLIGVALLLCCQDFFDFDMVWKLLLPAILVIIGLSIIFKDIIHTKVNKEIKKLNKNKSGDNEYAATFSGQNLKFDDEEFKGADLNAVFGGIKCDLTKAIINSDQVINASAIFGGVDIYVPSNVKVKVKSTPIFGGVTDKSNQTTDDGSHVIYINAVCVFGGVEIK